MAPAEQGQQKAVRLINDLQDISFTKIGLILLVTWLVILLARKVLVAFSFHQMSYGQ